MTDRMGHLLSLFLARVYVREQARKLFFDLQSFVPLRGSPNAAFIEEIEVCIRSSFPSPLRLDCALVACTFVAIGTFIHARRKRR